MKTNTPTHEVACLPHYIQSIQCRMVTCSCHLEEAITSSRAVPVVSSMTSVVLTTYSWRGIRLYEVQVLSRCSCGKCMLVQQRRAGDKDKSQRIVGQPFILGSSVRPSAWESPAAFCFMRSEPPWQGPPMALCSGGVNKARVLDVHVHCGGQGWLFSLM